jgi:hypothetical protein
MRQRGIGSLCLQRLRGAAGNGAQVLCGRRDGGSGDRRRYGWQRCTSRSTSLSCDCLHCRGNGGRLRRRLDRWFRLRLSQCGGANRRCCALINPFEK